MSQLAVGEPGYVVGLLPATSNAPADARLCTRVGLTDLVMAPRTMSIPGLNPLAKLEYQDRMWLLRSSYPGWQFPHIPPDFTIISLPYMEANCWLVISPAWRNLDKLPQGMIQKELKPHHRTPIKEKSAMILPGTGYDRRIAWLVSQVSQNNLTTTVQDMVNFGTRYSYYPQSKDAAEYLRERFTSYGVATEYQTYYSGYTLSSMIYTPNGSGFACGNFGTLLRKSNDQNWVKLNVDTTMGLNDLYFVDDLEGWVVGMEGTVLHTINRGNNWSSVDIGSPNALLGVHFVNSNLGFICANDGSILRTTDGGTSWQSLPTGTNLPLFELQFSDSAHGWAVGSDGLIIATTDGGDSWQQQNSGTTILLDSLSFVDNLHGWAVGNVGRTIVATVDGGTTWIQQSPPAGNEYLGGVQFINSTTGWAVGAGGLVLKTEDGGLTWVEYHTGTENDLVSIFMRDLLQGTVCGYEAALFDTGDGGTNWLNRQSTLDPQMAWLNLIATIPGVSPTEVVASAHYDSKCYENSSLVAPGADDDASGCAAILELARLFSGASLGKTLKLILFSGEEQGMLGSQAYVSDALTQGEQLLVDFQADMIGYTGDDGRIFSIYDHIFDGPGTDFVAAGNAYVPGAAIWDLDIDPTATFSDHSSFWQNGISASLEAERNPQNNPFYHTVNDLPNTLDVTFMEAGARGMMATIASRVGIASGIPFEGLGSAHPYPNPYHPSQGSLHWTGLAPRVHLRLYDLSGEKVLDLWLDAPQGLADWDGRIAGGSYPAAGVYLYQLQDESGATKTGKLAVLK